MLARSLFGAQPPFLLLSIILVLGSGAPAEAAGQQQRDEGPERIVAIGDLHGDLNAARAALQLARLIDEEDNWIGGETVVVQTGDILDRGDDEEEIMELFHKIQRQAEAAGGAVHLLNGNHELMNASQDFRYVTQGALSDFRVEFDPADSALANVDPAFRQREAAFRPGGDYAKILATRETMTIVGKTAFAHGGILPEHLELGLDRMNEEIQEWLQTEGARPPSWVISERSPVWTRLYSNAPNQAACDTLGVVLAGLSVDRMVVAHTVKQTGITAYCGGRVWCIDVGMAKHYAEQYGGRPEVLEIRGEIVRSIRWEANDPVGSPSSLPSPPSSPGAAAVQRGGPDATRPPGPGRRTWRPGEGWE
jgi:hypothetical protein